jgi:hypothetical protein
VTTLYFTPQFKPRTSGGIFLEPDLDFPIKIDTDYNLKGDDGFDVVGHVEWLEEHLRNLYGGQASGFYLPEDTKREWVRQIYKDARDACLEAGEDGPYSKEAIDLVKKLKPLIIGYAQELNVNPIAVAGAIADEYSDNYNWVDFIHDGLLSTLSNETIVEKRSSLKKHKLYPIGKIELLEELPEQIKDPLEALIAGYNGFVDGLNKVLDKGADLTTSDVGKGNIKLKTAMKLQNKYPVLFTKKMMEREMADYLASDEGTVKLAALFMKHAEKILGKHLTKFGKDEKIKTAFLITAYKQGSSHFNDKIEDAISNKKLYQPGEGNRVICYWEIFKKIFP